MSLDATHEDIARVIEDTRPECVATSCITSTYPDVVFTGHMVTLIDETSASDGDIFPYMFRAAGLGPLIGKSG